ncbi:JM57 [macacine gammaherpesvirus 11]|uniref:JM57 n=2 Tax=macacine gammaherpesvirus 11 TaxID=2560570 RepID=G9JMN5_9GAMA|nr:JM57 [Macaca fuscata rhadinovirus]AAT00034.1 JM57 [Macaca fuscata rhadinovirus]AEW87582.1 JM57 [Macaca fuscata rhadinovirus]AEW87752.1 JM57 [Macaca fuscata rhadinovirus]
MASCICALGTVWEVYIISCFVSPGTFSRGCGFNGPGIGTLLGALERVPKRIKHRSALPGTSLMATYSVAQKSRISPFMYTVTHGPNSFGFMSIIMTFKQLCDIASSLVTGGSKTAECAVVAV